MTFIVDRDWKGYALPVVNVFDVEPTLTPVNRSTMTMNPDCKCKQVFRVLTQSAPVQIDFRSLSNFERGGFVVCNCIGHLDGVDNA